MVHTEGTIPGFLPMLDEMMDGGLVTMESGQDNHHRPVNKS